MTVSINQKEREIEGDRRGREVLCECEHEREQRAERERERKSGESLNEW